MLLFVEINLLVFFSALIFSKNVLLFKMFMEYLKEYRTNMASSYYEIFIFFFVMNLTYIQGFFINIIYFFKNLGICHDADITDIEGLPEAIPRGIFKHITLIEEAAASFVTFNMETTDLGKLYFCN